MVGWTVTITSQPTNVLVNEAVRGWRSCPNRHPDTEDPDFDSYHGRTGEVVEVIEDDAGEHTGDERDSYLFAVEFENGENEHFRWRDLRPAPEDTDGTH